MALEGARLVAMYLRRAVSEPGNVRQGAGWRSEPGCGLAVGITDVAGCHCLAKSMARLRPSPRRVLRCDDASDHGVQPPVSEAKYVRLAGAFGIEPGGRRRLSSLRPPSISSAISTGSLASRAMSSLIRREDLDVSLEGCSEHEPASNPREADKDAFRAMFERALAI